MIDIIPQIEAIEREVASRSSERGEFVSVLLRRAYRASVEDVWDAVTDPERSASVSRRSSDPSRLVRSSRARTSRTQSGSCPSVSWRTIMVET